MDRPTTDTAAAAATTFAARTASSCRRRPRPVTFALVLGAAGLLAVAGLAEAQNRVDQRSGGAERVQPGRAGGPPPPGTPPVRSGARRVDQSASQFRGGQNPIAPDPGAEFRRRNAVVTSNVAGGRGFRGNVGYSAPFDFRGDEGEAAFGVSALGSDDLYQFRAGSLFSDPRLLSLSPAIRYGSALGELEVVRNARGTSANDLRQADLQARQFEDFEFRQQVDARMSDLRRLVDATALGAGLEQFVSQTGGPTPVGVIRAVDADPRRLDASPLAGLQPALSDADLNRFGVPTTRREAFGPSEDPYLVSGALSPMDRARLIEDAREGRGAGAVGEAFRDSFVDTRIDPQDRMDRARDERIDGSVRSPRVGDTDPEDEDASIPAWQRIREEIARRYASDGRGGMAVDGTPSEEELRGLETDLDRLRRGLGADPGATPSPDARGTPGAPGMRDRPGFPGAAPGGEDDEAGEDEVQTPEDLLRLSRSLRHGQRIDALVDAEDRSRAGELIGTAEQELRRGDYFRAERTFTRALRLVPGHPTATVGLAHARLGAGLYIPSAMVIRDLFTYQPEMIGATYAEGLVPNRPRLLRALETLRGRVDDERDAGDTGLLLAYLGRLLERPEIVREGLAVMRQADAEDVLLNVLEAVWIEGPLDRGDGDGAGAGAGG